MIIVSNLSLGERDATLIDFPLEENSKHENHATQGSSSSTSHDCDEKLDNIMATLQNITTKISELATIMHSQHIRFNAKFTSLQTQLDQVQRKLEEHDK